MPTILTMMLYCAAFQEPIEVKKTFESPERCEDEQQTRLKALYHLFSNYEGVEKKCYLKSECKSVEVLK